MSRRYYMRIHIAEPGLDRVGAIEIAVQEEWNVDSVTHVKETKELYLSGESSLAGGETEEEFADRIAETIWKANGAYCEIEVGAVYLEELPCDYHIRSEEDYKRFVLS